MVKEKKHLPQYTIWPWPMGQGHAKYCSVSLKAYDLCTCKIWNRYVQQFRRRCIYKKVHNLNFGLDFGSRPHKCCSVSSTSCGLFTCKVLGGYVKRFRMRCIYKKIQYLTLTVGVKVTLNVARYFLHRVAYSPARFEVSTSDSSGGDAFTRRYIIWWLYKMLSSTLYIMWPI